MLTSRFSKVNKIFDIYSTEGMALAVLEELILCILMCIISMLTNWYALWLGGFIAYTIHLVIHIVQSIAIKKYIPALVTSLIALPISIYLIGQSIKLLGYSVSTVLLFGIIGVTVIAINLKLAHILIHMFTKWMGQ